MLSGISDLYFGSYPLADYPEFQQGGFYGCIKNAKIYPDSIDHSVISSDQVDLVNVELECEPVTGERLPGEHTSLEFEIATLATDGSGFSGEKSFYSFGPGCAIEKEYFTSFLMTQPAPFPQAAS